MVLVKNTSTAPMVNLLLKNIFKKGAFMKRKKYQKDITHPHFFAVRLSAMELEFLNQKMCDYVQGYYCYKPMPAHEMEKILRNLQ